jgi:hypothetical protein
MVAIIVMGTNLGCVIALSVIFYFTKDLDPKYAFLIIAIFPITFSFFGLICIKEPLDL